METAEQHPPAPFQPGDRLGTYAVVAVRGGGTFSHNLKVQSCSGEFHHAVVHRQVVSSPGLLRQGLLRQKDLAHPRLARIWDVCDLDSLSHGRTWFVRELL